MTPTKKLILCSLLAGLIGGGLLLWLFSENKTASTSIVNDKDSTSVPKAQEAIAVDTAKDIEIIKAYYKFLLEDTSDWEEYEELEHKYLTQTLIDKLSAYNDADYFPLLPIEDLETLSSRGVKVQSLGKEWYRIRLFDSAQEKWISIPIRMVTDRDGQRKIGYAIPYGWDGAVSDSMFYKHIIKIKEKEQDGLSFLKAFCLSYMSLNNTIDLDAPAYRKYLETFIDKKIWYLEDERMYFRDCMDYLWEDGTQTPANYTITPDGREGWYKVRVTIEHTTELYYEYLLKLEKRNGHFVITDIDWDDQDASSDIAVPERCDTTAEVYTVSEQLPEFPGGQKALLEYLCEHTIYPKEEEKARNEGRVLVSFIVNRDGSLSDIEITRSVSKGLDEEALRVVRSMPAWIPGNNGGQPVPVRYTLPINFRLE